VSDAQGSSAPGRASDDRFLDHLSSAADMVGGRRFREAEVEVLRALSITPSDLRALKLLALVRFKLGRLDEARALCREIAETQPRDPGVRLKLGLIALKLDRIDESVHELETAARLAPDDPRAWNYLGFAYARRGERPRAVAAFRRAGSESMAAELEAEGELSPPGGRSEGEGSGPRVSSGPGSGRAIVSPGALPSATFEPAFDLSIPMDARSMDARAISTRHEEHATRAEPDRALAGPLGNVRELPPAPLVGYAVSRLAPPLDQAAWLGATARLAIGDGAFVRADAAVACAGNVRWEAAQRRVRGRNSVERLGKTDAPFFRVQGRGELFVAAPSGRLVPLLLEDDVLYVREDAVMAFEGSVSWEYGHIPRAPLGMLQFRGRGLVTIRVRGETGAVKVSPDKPVQATERHLLGWVGRVVARGGALAEESTGGGGPVGPLPITCEGEGVVLFDVEREGGRIV
jgi:uncharacterized protein (AIM24 family)